MKGKYSDAGEVTSTGNHHSKNPVDYAIDGWPATDDSGDCDFHVCAVGASAGGLPAINELFAAIPPDLGAAYVVIQHLLPDHESRMPEVLSSVTEMPIKVVVDAGEGMAVRPDHIYLLPPGKTMVMQNGRLLLSERLDDDRLSLPIDHFLLSLAEDHGRFATAVILSGAGADGSSGVADVRRNGGLVLVQAPESASFDEMPNACIKTGLCDVVMQPSKLAESFAHYVKESLSREQLKELELSNELGLGSSDILNLLSEELKIDFNGYRLEQLHRRIMQHESLKGFDSTASYLNLIEQDESERSALLSNLFIGETGFFQDKEAFDLLQHEALTKIIASKKNGEFVRVWIPGCATGEEAYSIAMLIEESIKRAGRSLNVKYFASDINRSALDFAGIGLFSEEQVRAIPLELLGKYFVRTKDCYQVISALRQQLVFVRHDLMTDAPFTRMDLICCRNVLSYFKANSRNKILSLFHFSTNPGGFLFLGPGEGLGALKDGFELVSSKWRLFRKLRDVQLASIKTQRATFLDHMARVDKHEYPLRVNHHGSESRVQRAYDAILGKILPAGYLIDNQLRLLHTFGKGGDFLVAQTGRQSDQLTEMIHSDLRAPLNSAAQRCIRTGDSVRYTGVKASLDPKVSPQTFALSVDIFNEDESAERFLLVTLEPASRGTLTPEELTQGDEVDLSLQSHSVLVSLKDELRFTRENLQATIEALESSNHELHKTNEATVASNDELQRTNEELQSVNEELNTVNAEYHRKNLQLRDSNDDMDNLLRSCDVAVLFLDAEMNIRRFTPRLGDLFSLRVQDIGRPIANFRAGFVPDSLLQSLAEVMRSRIPRNEELDLPDGKTYLIRVTPFDSASSSDGVVLNYTETTLLREREESAKRWASIVESTADCIVAFDLARTVTQWNRAATEKYGYSNEEAVGANFFDLLIPRGSRDENAVKIEMVRSEQVATEYQTRRRSKSGKIVDVSVRLSPVMGESGIIGISSIERDITRELRESRLREFENAIQTKSYSGKAIPECWDDLQILAKEKIGARCFWLWQFQKLSKSLQPTYSGFGSCETEWFKENPLAIDDLVSQVVKTLEPVSRLVPRLSDPQSSDTAAESGDRIPATDESSDSWQLMLFPIEEEVKTIGVVGFLVDSCEQEALSDLEVTLASVSKILGLQISEQFRYDELVRISGIVENANDFIATADDLGNVVSLNRAARLITGVGLDDDPVGRQLTEFFAPESVQTIVSEGIPNARRMGTWTGETEIMDASEHRIPVSQLITVHRDSQGNLEYISTICRIIADQKNIQERLGRLIHKSATESEAQTSFLTNISHDVRTPMATVIGMAELLLEQPLTNDQKEMSESIRSSGVHVTQLLDDLLDFSKIESGRLAVKNEPFRVLEVIEETLDSYLPVVESLGIDLKREIGGIPPYHFLVDCARLRQVLDNLLSNAIKFTSHGFVLLKANLVGKKIVIEVADTGCGIEQSLLSAVFDPYTQSVPASSHRVRGAGLGLAISRKLAQLMGGSVEVSSIAGEGSTFTLTLPATRVNECSLGIDKGDVVTGDPLH